jgi:hypothetical protein
VVHLGVFTFRIASKSSHDFMTAQTFVKMRRHRCAQKNLHLAAVLAPRGASTAAK